MKALRILLIICAFGITVLSVQSVNAQCAACTASVETNAKSGSHTTKGLNNGIMYLLAAPYLVVAIGGYVWYKNYRRKNIAMEMRSEKLHLN